MLKNLKEVGGQNPIDPARLVAKFIMENMYIISKKFTKFLRK